MTIWPLIIPNKAASSDIKTGVPQHNSYVLSRTKMQNMKVKNKTKKKLPDPNLHWEVVKGREGCADLAWDVAQL